MSEKPAPSSSAKGPAVAAATTKTTKRYSVNEKAEFVLPVSKEKIAIRRMTWGERLDVDVQAAAGTRDGRVRDSRKFRQVLVEFATRSGPDIDDGMSSARFYSLDPTDGYALVEEVSRVNLIDNPAFLPQSEREEAETDTSQDS